MINSSQPVEDKVDFYKASTPRLAGRKKVLPTLRYLNFRRLLVKLRDEVEKDLDPTVRVKTFLELLDVIGVEGNEATTIQILLEMIVLNPVMPLLAWQKKINEDSTVPPEDIVLESNVTYEGRELAGLVTTLAKTFHWTADYVLNELTYYEACIYMQEALIVEHEDKSWDYMMSQVGFEKRGSDYVKKPLPDLPWMHKIPVRKNKVSSPVPDKYKVTGVTIDYTIDPGGQVQDVPPTPGQTGS